MQYKRNDQSILMDYLEEWQQYADAGGCDHHSLVGAWPDQLAFQPTAHMRGNFVDQSFLMNNKVWGPIVLEDYLYSLYGSTPVKNNASA